MSVPFPPGTFVSVPFRVLGVPTSMEHVGVISDRVGPDGMPLVISSTSHGWKVVEECWEDFAEGEQVTAYPLEGNHDPRQVLREARAQIGKPYHLLRNNCEHLAHQVAGVPAKSPQLRNAAKAVGAMGALAALALGLGWRSGRASNPHAPSGSSLSSRAPGPTPAAPPSGFAGRSEGWQREGGSNPQGSRSAAFKAAAVSSRLVPPREPREGRTRTPRPRLPNLRAPRPGRWK